MAEPARQLTPEDFEATDDSDVIDISDEFDDPEEYEVTEGQGSDDQGETIDGRDRFEELNERRERLKDKQEVRKQKREAKEQEQLRTDESKKPPKQEQRPDNPELRQKNIDKAKSEADKVKSTKQKLDKNINKKVAGEGEKAAAKTASKAAGKEVAAVGKKGARQAARAAGDAVKQTAKRVAAQAEKALAKFISRNPYALAIIGGIILIFLAVIAGAFILHSIGGGEGKGPAQYPETALQKQQSNFLLAVSGDKIAQDTVIKDVIESELERYDRIESNARTYDSSQLAASIATKKAEFEVLLQSALAEQDPLLRKDILSDARTQMIAFDNTLPFGSWIERLARDRIGSDNTNFCTITGANSRVACASFVSTVTYFAGVPNAIVANTTAVWNNSSLSTVIDRPVSKAVQTYNESVLQPGDLIWWGDGTCSSVNYSGKLFDHIGFYVGNGEAIDTSSSQEKVVIRSVTEGRGSCRVFNGAKRYGR